MHDRASKHAPKHEVLCDGASNNAQKHEVLGDCAPKMRKHTQGFARLPIEHLVKNDMEQENKKNIEETPKTMFQRLPGELGAPPHSGVSETCAVLFRAFVFGFLSMFFLSFFGYTSVFTRFWAAAHQKLVKHDLLHDCLS